MTASAYIVHAHADLRLARQLAALLVSGAGLEPRCVGSSSSGSARTAPFHDDARARLEQAHVVVVIASLRLFRSASASCEMGAAWALRKPVIALLVPPSPRLRDFLAGVPARRVDLRDELDRLADDVCRALGWPAVPACRWARARDELLAGLELPPGDRSLATGRGRRRRRRALAGGAGVTHEALLREVVDVLTSVAHDSEIATTIVRRAGFPPEHRPEYKSALGYWSVVVEQAAQGRIELQALIAEAQAQFPFNQALESVRRRTLAQATRSRASVGTRAIPGSGRPPLASAEGLLALVRAADEALAPLSGTTREAIFWHLRGTESSCELRPRKRYDDMHGPLAYKEIVPGRQQGCYVPNRTHPRVARALDALEELRAWLSTATRSEGLMRWYAQAFPGSILDVENREFWDRHLTSHGSVRLLG